MQYGSVSRQAVSVTMQTTSIVLSIRLNAQSMRFVPQRILLGLSNIKRSIDGSYRSGSQSTPNAT